MARPTGASSATRLGPGMETIELTFLPDGGWEAAVASAAAARTAAALPPRWVISWSVGPGATVDRGLKLAKLHCVGVDKNGGPGDTKEHFIVGEHSSRNLMHLAAAVDVGTHVGITSRHVMSHAPV